MRKLVPLALGTAMCLGALTAAAPQNPRTAPATIPTYTKDIAPILFKNCTSCHRPGEIGPMSLLTYDDVRPRAKDIRDKIDEGVMPPWHADAAPGTFLNERGLSQEEKSTIFRWVANGAPKGDPKDMPPTPQYPNGWSIGAPDVVFEMTEDYRVPADDVVQYEYFYIPTNFTEPKWVQAIEIRPGNRNVVHHVLVRYKAKPDVRRTPLLKLNPDISSLPKTTPGLRPKRADDLPARLLATYAPGTNPQVFRSGTALRLEPGGVLELQMHYTAAGQDETDRTRVGMIFSKDPSPREVLASQFFNATLKLPAGAAEVQVDADVEFAQDATVWGLFPHTHVRGKRWEYVLQLPDGSKKTILSVPRYNFNWQTYYMFSEPLRVPKGSKILSTAWYDNSAGNRANPDPTIDVGWGDQTWEEMQYTGILVSASSPSSSSATSGNPR
ncbi:MAG TPA: cytochrome c [Vicinamibacterales bacterium]|nr:cytochrome c [Vicinamibacterales bacterium]